MLKPRAKESLRAAAIPKPRAKESLRAAAIPFVLQTAAEKVPRSASLCFCARVSSILPKLSWTLTAERF
jgi:hypothetical protein